MPASLFCLVASSPAPEPVRWAKEVFAATKSFFVEWPCWPLHPSLLTAASTTTWGGVKPAVIPAQTRSALLSQRAWWLFGVLRRGELGVHNVHTWGFGPGRTSGGFTRIP
jgi:hypothetical protein